MNDLIPVGMREDERAPVTASQDIDVDIVQAEAPDPEAEAWFVRGRLVSSDSREVRSRWRLV